MHSLNVKRINYEENVNAESPLLFLSRTCTLIADFVQIGDCETAFWILQQKESVMLDDAKFPPLLTLLHDDKFYKSTMTIKLGLEFDNILCNATFTINAASFYFFFLISFFWVYHPFVRFSARTLKSDEVDEREKKWEKNYFVNLFWKFLGGFTLTHLTLCGHLNSKEFILGRFKNLA